MGVLGRLKDRLGDPAGRRFGRVSESADVGIDVVKPTTKKNGNGNGKDDSLFESDREKSQRKQKERIERLKDENIRLERDRKGESFRGKARQVFERFNESEGKRRGRRSSIFDDIIGPSGRSSRRRDSGFNLDFDSMVGFGPRSRPKRISGSRGRGEVPIYSNGKIVGFRRMKGAKRKRQRDPFDLSF